LLLGYRVNGLIDIAQNALGIVILAEDEAIQPTTMVEWALQGNNLGYSHV
jgi:hypothetical protein